MKAICIYFPIMLSLLIGLVSCQSDELAPVQPNGLFPGPVDKIPPPNVIPPDDVVRTLYAGATKWRITYNNVNINFGQSYQRFFSTLDGSFQNKAQLNSNPYATARVDMDLMFWFISSLDNQKYKYHLTYPASASATRFKPAEFGPWQLATMTIGNPAQFETEFEHSMFEATQFQPYNYEADGDESTLYDDGDIFLFKTGRDPVRYGAVHIIARANWNTGTEQSIIDVTVQADNNIVDLGD